MGTAIIVLLILGVIGWISYKSITNNSDEDVSTVEYNKTTITPNKMKKEYNESIEIAKDILNNKNDYVILDTETTGLGDNDVIVQIGVIDMDGNVLLSTLIKPTKRMNAEATAIHGITMKMLSDQPTFADIYPKFKEVIKNKKVLIYNNTFDVRLINQTAFQDGINLNNFTTICIMKLYAIFKNEWSSYHKWYKYPKLPEGDHSATGDCQATLKIINEIAKGEIKK